MAETEKDKAWVNVLMEKDLIDEMEDLVKDLDTDRSKLIRTLLREKLEAHRRLNKTKVSRENRSAIKIR
jgi:metal-responsive CopG/Arc/MetJ family transcriptional regulator